MTGQHSKRITIILIIKVKLHNKNPTETKKVEVTHVYGRGCRKDLDIFQRLNG